MYKHVQDRRYCRYGTWRTIGTSAFGRTRRSQLAYKLMIDMTCRSSCWGVVSAPANDTLSTSGMAPLDAPRCQELQLRIDSSRAPLLFPTYSCGECIIWPRPPIIDLFEHFTYPSELAAGHRGSDKRGSTVFDWIINCTAKTVPLWPPSSALTTLAFVLFGLVYI